MLGDEGDGVFAELQVYALQNKQVVVLLGEGVAGVFEDGFKRLYIQVLQEGDYGEAADKFGNEAE